MRISTTMDPTTSRGNAMQRKSLILCQVLNRMFLTVGICSGGSSIARSLGSYFRNLFMTTPTAIPRQTSITRMPNA